MASRARLGQGLWRTAAGAAATRAVTVADAAGTGRGLVLVCCFFDHPGRPRDAGFSSPIAAPNSMMIWELFKVAGGRIRRIEAIGAAFPYGMRAGW